MWSSKISKKRWKCWKSAESDAFRLTFKYQSNGCATKFRHRNSYMRIKRPELRPNDGIPQRDIAVAQKARSVEQFLAQKSITEMERAPYFLIYLRMTSGCFQNRVCLQGMKISGHWRHPLSPQKKWRRHWKLFHNRCFKNVSNSSSIIRLSA
jgi:hypothetical protein